MKLKTSLSLLVLTSSISLSSFAAKDCGPYKIDYIQIEGTTVYFDPDGAHHWQSLGSLTTPGTKERYSALLAAQMSGNKVSTRFHSDNHNCQNYNLTDAAYMVRVHAQGK